jgi:hypothetical protein
MAFSTTVGTGGPELTHSHCRPLRETSFLDFVALGYDSETKAVTFCRTRTI